MSRVVDLGIQGLREGCEVERVLTEAGVFGPDVEWEPGPGRGFVYTKGGDHLYASNVTDDFTDKQVKDLAATATGMSEVPIDEQLLVLGEQLGVERETLRTAITQTEIAKRLDAIT